MRYKIIGESLKRNYPRGPTLKQLIRKTVELSEGGLRFEDLIGRLSLKKFGILPENPDVIESIIGDMKDVKILSYQASNCVKRFVYVPVGIK